MTTPVPLASAAPPASASVAIVAAPRPIPSASAAPGAVRGVEIPAIPDGGCEVRADAWRGTISLRPGLVFARVGDVPATLTLQEPPGAHVSLDASIRLHALVENAAIYAAKPTTLGGFVVPLADQPLGWARVERPGKITVEVDTKELFAEPVKAIQEVDCASLAATESKYDVRASIGASAGVEVTVESGAQIAETPGGPIVATLRPDAAMWAVVLESKGARRRIAADASGYWVVGWIDAKFVGPKGVMAIGPGWGELGTYGMSSGPPRSCGHELPVFGQIAGERAHLGTLRAGTGYERSEPQPIGLEKGWVAIHLVSHWLTPVDGASLLVRTEDLDGCP